MLETAQVQVELGQHRAGAFKRKGAHIGVRLEFFAHTGHSLHAAILDPNPVDARAQVDLHITDLSPSLASIKLSQGHVGNAHFIGVRIL